MTDHGEVVARLKQVKAERGLTNEALADKSGVSLGTVNKIFSGGIGSIKLGTLFSLANALGIAVSELTETHTMPPHEEKENFGLIRVMAFSPETVAADLEGNAKAIIRAVKEAAAENVSVLVMPYLSLTGECGALIRQTEFLSLAERYIKFIADSTANSPLFFFGAPIRKDGRVYNSAVCCNSGKILGVVPESRAGFKSASDIFICREKYPFGKLVFCNSLMPEMRVGVEVGDIFSRSADGATLIAGLSEGKETLDDLRITRSGIEAFTAKTDTVYVLSGAFKGAGAGQCIISECGKILFETKPFAAEKAQAEADLALVEQKGGFSGGNFGIEGAEVCFEQEIPALQQVKRYSPTPFLPKGRSELNEISDLLFGAAVRRLKNKLSAGVKEVVCGKAGLPLSICIEAFSELGLDKSGISDESPQHKGEFAKMGRATYVCRHDLTDILLGKCACPQGSFHAVGEIPKTLLNAVELNVTDLKADEDTVLNDFILYHILQSGFAPAKIIYIIGQAFDTIPEREAAEKLKTIYLQLIETKKSGRESVRTPLSSTGEWSLPAEAALKRWADEAEIIGRDK